MKNFLLIICQFLFLISWGQLAVHNDGSMQMHANSNMGVKGDIANSGTFNNNLGKVWLNGTARQTIEGTNPIQFNDLELNNSAGLKVDNELQVAAMFAFASGIVYSDRSDTATEFVHFLAGSSYSGSGSSTHIDGVVKKTGNTAFIFPTGHSGKLMPISITAPAQVSDEFRAYYSYENPFPDVGTFGGGSYDPTINNVSSKEYWILDRTNGSAAVKVSLNWDVDSDVQEPLDLVITRWDGSLWQNEGGANILGNATAGSLQSLSPISSFSPFTLASTTFSNSLPIELLDFNAHKMAGQKVKLNWQTLSEINNDYFTVERSNDRGEHWQGIGQLKGAGNSTQELHYELMDYAPLTGENYYRLKQTDFDGQTEYFEVKVVVFDANEMGSIQAYPNPVINNEVNISLKSLASGAYSITLLSAEMKVLMRKEIHLEGQKREETTHVQFQDLKLKSGVYYLRLNGKTTHETIPIIKL